MYLAFDSLDMPQNLWGGTVYSSLLMLGFKQDILLFVICPFKMVKLMLRKSIHISPLLVRQDLHFCNIVPSKEGFHSFLLIQFQAHLFQVIYYLYILNPCWMKRCQVCWVWTDGLTSLRRFPWMLWNLKGFLIKCWSFVKLTSSKKLTIKYYQESC